MDMALVKCKECKHEISKKAKNAPTAGKLTSAFVVDKTNAVCYEYRSQNGFGGMSAGEAVLSSDKKKFLTSDMDGFKVLFNKECANKEVYEMVKSITWNSL